MNKLCYYLGIVTHLSFVTQVNTTEYHLMIPPEILEKRLIFWRHHNGKHRPTFAP